MNPIIRFVGRLLRPLGYSVVATDRLAILEKFGGPHVGLIKDAEQFDAELRAWDMETYLAKVRAEKAATRQVELGTEKEEAEIAKTITPATEDKMLRTYLVPDPMLTAFHVSEWEVADVPKQ
jgi:hypothetical protein